MTRDLQQVRQYAPFAVPLVIVAIGWFAVIRPTAAESARVRSELDGLRQRVETVRAHSGPPLPAAPPADPLKLFENRVAPGDPSGRLLEELSRLAMRTGVSVEMLETGDEAITSASGGPAVAGGVATDPRFVLFQTPLKYTPVTLRAEADYASLGEFLWRLRDLATVVEVRTLDVVAPESSTDIARPTGMVRVTLAMFAYSRAPGAVR